MTDPATPKYGTPARTDRPPSPTSVRLAVAGILVLAVLSLQGVWMAVDPSYRSFLSAQLEQSTPGGLSAPALDAARCTALIVMGVGSIVVSAVLVSLAVKVRSGRRWARLAVTIVLVMGLYQALRHVMATDHHPGPLDQLTELVDLVVRCAVLGSLWAPEDARAFFGRNRHEPPP